MIKRKQLVKLGIGAVVVGLFIAGYLLFIRSESPAKERKVIYDTSEDDKLPEDQLIRVPKDAKSATCESIKTESVEKALNFKANSTRVSLQNTTSQDGKASGCTYINTEEPDSLIKSVSITVREYNDVAKADSAYAVLDKGNNQGKQKLNNDAYFSEDQSQLVAIKDTRLSVVTISKTSSKSLGKDSFAKLYDILQ